MLKKGRGEKRLPHPAKSEKKSTGTYRRREKFSFPLIEKKKRKGSLRFLSLFPQREKKRVVPPVSTLLHEGLNMERLFSLKKKKKKSISFESHREKKKKKSTV